MKSRLLTIAIEQETDIVPVRQRSRRLAGLLGFDQQDQTRITTAISEIARNAIQYGRGGRVEYALVGDAAQPALEITIRDQGDGIADITAILSGAYQSKTGMGIGIRGARRLMERFDITTAAAAGTTVRMEKSLPRRTPQLTAKDLPALLKTLEQPEDGDPLREVRRQNHEMLVQLEEIARRQEELHQLNKELEDTNRGVVALYAELAEQADHLRHADQLKSRFLSNMSHEFRTPLNSILALSRLVLGRTDGALTAEQEKQILFIRKAAENLKELVDDLLDLAKVEAGKIVVTPVEFNVTNLFGTLRGMLRPLLVGDSVELLFEDTGDMPILLTDEGKVSQILRNFISNALKFTERGEVRVWIQADRDTDTVTFHVRDTGIGIAPQDIDIIWQEFGQVAHAAQARVKGTGLGLPLSKKLAELLGGHVAVQSAPGQGSVFTLTIPRVYLHATDPGEDDAMEPLDPSRLPILAVEDDPADAFALERAFAQSPYQLVLVHSTAAARKALERFAPAVIILDIMLAGEETWRFLIEMKQRSLTREIPIIVVSTAQEERKARNLGAGDYLDKPINPMRLMKALDALMESRSITKVLVVDDEEVSRYLVRQLLPRGTFELSEASTGRDGLQRISDDRPDVILLDLDMPVMNGFEMLEELVKVDEPAMPPAVVLTATQLDGAQRERLHGAAQILMKSDLTVDTLVNAIRRAVGIGASGIA